MFNQGVTAVEITSLAGQTTGTGPAVPVNNRAKVGLLVEYSTGVSAGEVTLEAAATSDYSGLWSPQFTVGQPASVPGCAGQAAEIVGAFVRPRVTTTVSGGTIVKMVVYIY